MSSLEGSTVLKVLEIQNLKEPLNAWMLAALVGKSWFPGKTGSNWIKDLGLRIEGRGLKIGDRGSNFLDVRLLLYLLKQEQL